METIKETRITKARKKLKDLKTSMIAMVRNGAKYTILTNVLEWPRNDIILIDFANPDLYYPYREDLKHLGTSGMDIMSIHQPPSLLNCKRGDLTDAKLVWRREEIIKISKKDAIEELARSMGVDPSLIVIE